MIKNGYMIQHSYDNNFTKLMNRMEEKYSSKIFQMSGIGSQLDINEMSKQFFTNKTTPADISVDANANVGDKSIIAYMFELAKPSLLLDSYYRLWKWLCKNRSIEYANTIIEKQISGDIYVNDFHSFAPGKCYCFNYSTYDTALNGIPKELDSKGSSLPPKHLMAFKEQLILFCLLAGNSTAGAVGLADLLIVISIYFKHILENQADAHFSFRNEEACWKYLEATLTSLVYTLNQPYRGNEALFTNVSIFDRNFLDQLCPSYSLELDDKIYTAEPELVNRIQELFLYIMNKELHRRILTFPVTTACFSKDDDNNILDTDFLDKISKANLDYGFINIYAGKTSTLSSCCRLRSDTHNEYFNSFGSGSTKIGSMGVVTGNFPRLAYKHKGNPDTFISELKELVKDCQEINNAKRNIIKRIIKEGFAPLYTLGYMDLKKQYSTFGVSGFYECIEIMGYNILSSEGQQFALRILKVINETNDEMQKKFKAPHNTEQVPGETLSVKLADKDHFLGINKDYDLYSNQFIPLTIEANMLDRIKIQSLLDEKFSGGAIMHLNVDQQITSVDKLEQLIKHTIKQGVVYHAVNYILNECQMCNNKFVGNQDECPKCKSNEIIHYTRVVGFVTKVNNWNKTRRNSDYPNRQWY